MTDADGWERFVERHPAASPCELLEWAIEEGRAALVAAVLGRTDLDVNLPCDPERPDGVSPLIAALRAGEASVVLLVAAHPGFDLARSLPEYETWSWARTAPLDVFQTYLAIPGSDVNGRDGNGKTLLHEVVEGEEAGEKARDLLARPGIELDPRQLDGTTPLYRAALAGNDAAFELLLERGADVNNRNDDNHWTILMCAVAADRGTIAEPLLRRP